MDIRKPLDAKASSLMLLLCLIWGIQQIMIKLVVDDMSPVLQIALRSGFAALAVWVLMLFRREPLKLSDNIWRAGLVAGFLFAVEFLFVAEGLRYTTASHMSVFLYTAPVFAAIGLHLFLPEERLAKIQWFGVALAFLGVAIAFLYNSASYTYTATMLWGDILGLLAGASWGATTVVVRCSHLSSATTTHTLFYQLAGAFIILFIYALFSNQWQFSLTPKLAASLAFQMIVVSFISYLIWFSLLRRYLASRLGILSFMTPIFGVSAGIIILNDPVQPGFIFGSLLILLGIIIVSSYNLLLQKIRSRSRG